MNFMHVAKSEAAVFQNHLISLPNYGASAQNALPSALLRLKAPMTKLA